MSSLLNKSAYGMQNYFHDVSVLFIKVYNIKSIDCAANSNFRFKHILKEFISQVYLKVELQGDINRKCREKSIKNFSGRKHKNHPKLYYHVGHETKWAINYAH